MSTPAPRRNWRLFHRRMLGAYIVSLLWAFRAVHDGNVTDLAFCLAATLFIAALCYFWTHSEAPSRNFLRYH